MIKTERGLKNSKVTFTTQVNKHLFQSKEVVVFARRKLLRGHIVINAVTSLTDSSDTCVNGDIMFLHPLELTVTTAALLREGPQLNLDKR